MPENWIAERTKSFDSSGIRKIFDLAANLTERIDLSIGQPDFAIFEHTGFGQPVGLHRSITELSLQRPGLDGVAQNGVAIPVGRISQPGPDDFAVANGDDSIRQRLIGLHGQSGH